MIDAKDDKVLGADLVRIGLVCDCERTASEVVVCHVWTRVSCCRVGRARVVVGGISASVGGVALLAGGLNGDIAAGREQHLGSVWGRDWVSVKHPSRDGTAVERLVDEAITTMETVDGGMEDSDVSHGGGDESESKSEEGGSAEGRHLWIRC